MKQQAIITAVLVLLLIHSVRAAAHGGGQLIAGPTQAGPYLLSVWVNPPQPRIGEPLHFTVGVADPHDRAPVLDAQILIIMQGKGLALPPVSAEATTEQSINRLFYETDLNLEQSGPYQATVAVTGPEGEGEISFELEVDVPSGVNWFLLGLVGMVLVLIIGWWRARGARKVVEKV